MNVPVFTNWTWVDPDGTLTPAAQFYEDELNQSMLECLSENGWVPPSTTDTAIAASAQTMPDGTFWYDNVNHCVVFKINGTLQKVVFAPYP